MMANYLTAASSDQLHFAVGLLEANILVLQQELERRAAAAPAATTAAPLAPTAATSAATAMVAAIVDETIAAPVVRQRGPGSTTSSRQSNNDLICRWCHRLVGSARNLAQHVTAIHMDEPTLTPAELETHLEVLSRPTRRKR
jgi:hypothetical protein